MRESILNGNDDGGNQWKKTHFETESKWKRWQENASKILPLFNLFASSAIFYVNDLIAVQHAPLGST